jgi:hypothetical protein
MNKQSRQAGLGHVIALALVVLVFGGIGYIGYRLYAHPASNRSNSPGISTQSSPSANDAAPSEVPDAPEIKSASDLEAAQSVLDGVDPGSANQRDSSQLDAQLNGF